MLRKASNITRSKSRGKTAGSGAVQVPAPGEGKRGEQGYLGYLLRQAHAAVRLTMERTLADLGVTSPQFAVLTMLTKNTFVEEIRKQYVLVARAKGLSQKRVLYKHIFRNALIPLITGFPAAFIGAFFAGSVLIETLFSLDGLGLLGYEAVIRRDYPVVLGSLYFFTLIGLVTKLISDILYRVVDPRVQFGSVAK